MRHRIWVQEFYVKLKPIRRLKKKGDVAIKANHAYLLLGINAPLSLFYLSE
jgi:hypothetical protein